MEFEWDAAKAASNRQKHGVSFEEAETVFADPNAVPIFDATHSGTEDRYITIGVSDKGRLIVVSYTERNDKVRIISARTATKAEARHYP
jgi:hypothetical protein